MKWIVVFMAFVFSACSPKQPIQPRFILGRYNFNYEIEHPKNAGVIQAFDDGKDTFIKLYNLRLQHNAYLFYESIKKKKLLYTILQGNLVLVHGLHDKLEITAESKMSKIIRIHNQKTSNDNSL